MSLLSGFLGILGIGENKLRTPKVKKAGSLEMDDYEYGIDAYLRQLMKKSGFEKTIVTGGKKTRLGAGSYLGAV